MFIVSAAKIRFFSDIARVSAGKSIFIGLQGGLLLGDPVFYALAGALLEGYAEGAVAAVATAVGQLLGLDGLALGGGRRLAAANI